VRQIARREKPRMAALAGVLLALAVLAEADTDAADGNAS
jgi:hypothetical protein